MPEGEGAQRAATGDGLRRSVGTCPRFKMLKQMRPRS
jgi:hypothetical protein